jgi:transposase
MQKKELSLQIVHPHAAGIDVGSRSHFIAVDQDPEHVMEFGVYTRDHLLLIEHLKKFGITTVAMESTGSYWQTLFNALQAAGFDVHLVNGSQTKNVKGRKTDVIDCMWIQKLHSLGLLSGSFLLNDYVQQLRTYYSHRQHLLEQTSKYISKMQAVLRLMNIRLDVILRDTTGKSGIAVIQAILDGERDPVMLSSFVSKGVKKSRDEIIASLHGQWRDDFIFELRSCLSLYWIYEKAVLECDAKLESELLAKAPVIDSKVNLSQTRKKPLKHSPKFNIQQVSFAFFKTDLYQIPGVSHTTVLCLLTNMGNDIQKFRTGKQFASWLRLVPNNKISGGKIISHKTPPGKNQIARCLRMAANSIGNQKSHPLTPFFKRIAFRKGRVAAITATARKLAVIIWNMIAKQQPYSAFDYEKFNQKRKNSQLRNIQSRLAKLSLTSEELKNVFERASLSII